MKMKKIVLLMTPMRFTESWKIKEGKPPFCKIILRGITGVFELDAITSFIWINSDGSHTVDNIITEICDNFEDSTRTQVEHDVKTILEQWDADDLINPDYNSLYPYKDFKTLKKIKRKTRTLKELRRKTKVLNEHKRKKEEK